MQQLWCDDGLGFKSVIYALLYDFSNKFKVFINIHEYAKLDVASPAMGLRHMAYVKFGNILAVHYK